MPSIRAVGHEDRLSLVEHLDELRTRLIWCVVVFTAVFAVCYWQNDRLLDFVNQPLYDSQHLSEDGGGRGDPLEQSARFDRRLGEAAGALAAAVAGQQRVLERLAAGADLRPAERAALAAQARRTDRAVAALRAAATARPADQQRRPVTLGVTEPFVTTFTVAGYAALLLSLPFLLWQAYAFVLPAFTPQERRTALPLMLMVPALFVAGVVFGYVVALPRAVDFLQNFNDDAFDILLQARDYYRFSILLLLVIGLLFQIPVGVLAVTRLGVVSARQLAHNRGYVLLGLAVVAAVATPTPDPVTMLLAMAPLVVLWELSVLLARVFERRREAEPDDLWDAVEDPPTLS
jgi:sec-independent protein translocase protein TatC